RRRRDAATTRASVGPRDARVAAVERRRSADPLDPDVRPPPLLSIDVSLPQASRELPSSVVDAPVDGAEDEAARGRARASKDPRAAPPPPPPSTFRPGAPPPSGIRGRPVFVGGRPLPSRSDSNFRPGPCDLPAPHPPRARPDQPVAPSARPPRVRPGRQPPYQPPHQPPSHRPTHAPAEAPTEALPPKANDRTGPPKLHRAAQDYLRAWLLSRQHVEAPYPTERGYADLRRATGLNRAQLKNWFVMRAAVGASEGPSSSFRACAPLAPGRDGPSNTSDPPSRVDSTSSKACAEGCRRACQRKPSRSRGANNRRRIWRPAVDDLRRRHGLAESDPLPPAALASLEDEPAAPPPPYDPVRCCDPPAALYAPGRTVADSRAAAAAMIAMGGRATSPVGRDGSSSASTGSHPEAGSSAEAAAPRKPTPVPGTGSHPMPRALRVPAPRLAGAHVKFNVGGTVVQVPSDVLLRHPRSKIASMARCALRAGGDVPVPVPRDCELFSHCVRYLCRGKAVLPRRVQRGAFLRELRHFGIPHDEEDVEGGGCGGSPLLSKRAATSGGGPPPPPRRISPTTVAPFRGGADAARVAGPAPGAAGPPRPAFRPVGPPSSSAPIWPGPGPFGPATLVPEETASSGPPRPGRGPPRPSGPISAEPAPTSRPPPSTLDLLSSAISASSSGSLGAPAPRAPGAAKAADGAPPTARKAMCGKCDACRRDDCGECRACRDKPKFGGRGRLRRKCLRRKCSHMTHHTFLPARDGGGVVVGEGAEPTTEADPRVPRERAPAPEGTAAVPNLAVVAAARRWFENLAFLRPCIEEGGRINYDALQDDEIRGRVKNFVKEQRKQYRRREDGEATSLTDERLRLLADANFPWVFQARVQRKQEPRAMPAVVASAKLPAKPASRLDLLFSITSQSFYEVTSRGDNETEDDTGESRPATPLVPSECPQQISQSDQESNCGKFEGSLSRPMVNNADELISRRDKMCTKTRKKEEAKMRVELAKIRAELDAKAGGGEFGLKDIGGMGNESYSLDNFPGEGEDASGDESDIESSESGDDEIAEELLSVPSDGLCNAVFSTAMAGGTGDLPRGITIRPSGKWQVQLYYAGNSRYIGLFDSREEASTAYELARECRESFKVKDPTPQQVKSNLSMMRKAAFSGGEFRSQHTGAQPKPKAKSSILPSQKNSKAEQPRVKAVMKAKTKGVTSDKSSKFHNKQKSGSIAEADPDRAAIKTEEPNEKKRKPSSTSLPSKPSSTPPSFITVKDTEDSCQRKFSSELYEKAKMLAEALPRGITVRPSGKWQVQLYYAGKSRYIGVFDSKLNAAVAYELARGCFDKFKEQDPSEEQAKKNVTLMREAAFSFFQNGNKRRKTCRDEHKVKGGAKDQHHAKASCKKAKDQKRKRSVQPQRIPKKPKAEPNTNSKPGSDGAKEVAKSKKETAKEGAAERATSNVKTSQYSEDGSSSEDDTSSTTIKFGAVGYKFRKMFTDESGKELGWFDGEVVEIVSGADKDRKCFYAADGYIEDLSLSELEELRDLESKSCVEFGSVGYEFKKQFPGGRWFDGKVVKILKIGNGCDRRCHYPEDDDCEDLSLADLRKLADVETYPGKGKEEEARFGEVEHNDLCESCGEAGDLLCCSTCNLVFHLECTRPKLATLPMHDWSCAFCVASGDVTKNISKQEHTKALVAVQEIEALKEGAKKRGASCRSSSRKRKN
ncbi:hypothetical protein ACHAWF_017521, partial [Thalassiosira exigua]